MTEIPSKRKRSASLRTQMFNKHMYDRFNANDQTIELTDLNEIESNEEDELEDEEGGYDDERGDDRPSLFTKCMDALLDRSRVLHTKSGRQIPIALDHETAEYKRYTYNGGNLLIDERTERPYMNNQISSSRYTIYSFLPRQIYAQFSKLANVYFLVVAILPTILNWSAAGSNNMILPLCVFIGISMAREAYDEFKRHRLDKEENEKFSKVLTKTIRSESHGSRRTFVGDSHYTELNNNKSKLAPKKSLDTRFNNFNLLSKHHGVNTQWKKWEDLRVGDFVLLSQDDWVPADLLLLTTDGSDNECHVETMALDGQTSLKCKRPHAKLNKLAYAASGLANINAKVTVEDPKIDLSHFGGNLVLECDRNSTGIKCPLTLENVVLRGSVLRNTQNVVGMVVFTGEETKVRMNALKNIRLKTPKLQRKVNSIVIFMVIIVTAMSLFSYLAYIINSRHYVYSTQATYLFLQDSDTAPTIMSFIIMYNSIIPLSLYATMEIIRLMQRKLMEWDVDMYHEEKNTPCETRTATTLEELGQVSYIFSDKTGTLTENKMLLRKFSICGSSWLHKVGYNVKDEELETVQSNEDVNLISLEHRNAAYSRKDRGNVRKSFAYNGADSAVEYKGNSTAIYSGRPRTKFVAGEEEQSINSNQHFSKKGLENLKSSTDLIKYIQLYPNTLFAKKARLFILSLALCHNCLPITLNTSIDEDNDSVEYQSSSPDELALVTAARDLGYIVFNRKGKILTIKSFPHGFNTDPETDDYEILETINFNSKRKRMSVLVKMPNKPDKVLLICKGADHVILERLPDEEDIYRKLEEINTVAKVRKDAEAEVVIQRRRSLERIIVGDDVASSRLRPYLSSNFQASLPLEAVKKSMSQSRRHSTDFPIKSINQFLETIKRTDEKIDNVVLNSRIFLQRHQLERYGNINSFTKSNQQTKGKSGRDGSTVSDGELEMLEYIGNDNLITNNEYLLERTLQAIDAFSTEGLRTLLYGYKWINMPEYLGWKKRYHAAKTSLKDCKIKVDDVGDEIERNLSLLGVTAIEDKLQEGVTESVDKIRRAGIKMWMMTGDKRETAISIGYSCKLIHDYSTLIILTENDENIISKMNAISQEVEGGNVAHCVVVVDGGTLTVFESNPTLLSVFVELCTKIDCVICCRTSPSQKAMMVTNMRNTNKDLVTLAIGDGANDIAMMQSAEIGVGIVGREGLQASRSADYSIAQFSFLVKMLFVHGRYNYIRTSKFLLCTFYKQLTLLMTQLVFQKYTMFSGSSMYDLWGFSIYNTLFTSLPTLCIGMFEKDLKPATLLAIPELYSTGRLNQAFSFPIFFQWMILGTLNSLLVTFLNVTAWGETALKDNTLYTLGVINYTSVLIFANVKCQFIETHDSNWLVFASMGISTFGWFLWCSLLPLLYQDGSVYDLHSGFYHYISKNVTFWCSIFVLATFGIMIDIICKTLKVMLWPTDTDVFQQLEQRSEIRKKLECDAFNGMRRNWQRDHSATSVYRHGTFPSRSTINPQHSQNKKSSINNFGTVFSETTQIRSPTYDDDDNEEEDERYELLLNGTLIKKHGVEGEPWVSHLLPKKLRFNITGDNENHGENRAIVEQDFQ